MLSRSPRFTYSTFQPFCPPDTACSPMAAFACNIQRHRFQYLDPLLALGCCSRFVSFRLHLEEASSPDTHCRNGFGPFGSTDWLFTFHCSPPRLTATQLRSVSGPLHGPNRDLHPAGRARFRAHLPRFVFVPQTYRLLSRRRGIWFLWHSENLV